VAAGHGRRDCHVAIRGRYKRIIMPRRVVTDKLITISCHKQCFAASRAHSPRISLRSRRRQSKGRRSRRSGRVRAIDLTIRDGLIQPGLYLPPQYSVPPPLSSPSPSPCTQFHPLRGGAVPRPGRRSRYPGPEQHPVPARLRLRRRPLRPLPHQRLGAPRPRAPRPRPLGPALPRAAAGRRRRRGAGGAAAVDAGEGAGGPAVSPVRARVERVRGAWGPAAAVAMRGRGRAAVPQLSRRRRLLAGAAGRGCIAQSSSS
jgi:hypothetical protein